MKHRQGDKSWVLPSRGGEPVNGLRDTVGLATYANNSGGSTWGPAHGGEDFLG